mgnify:CR=1 FL=1
MADLAVIRVPFTVSAVESTCGQLTSLLGPNETDIDEVVQLILTNPSMQVSENSLLSKESSTAFAKVRVTGCVTFSWTPVLCSVIDVTCICMRFGGVSGNPDIGPCSCRC